MRRSNVRQLTPICEKCRMIVAYAMGENGRRITIEPRPVVKGNLRLLPPTEGGVPVARKVEYTIDLFDQDDDGLRYRRHTCA